MAAEKTLLYCWVSNGLSVLVPKKRGEGFLRQPFCHHANNALSVIETKTGCDIFGLDGHLEFASPKVRQAYIYRDRRAAFEAIALPLLTTHYGFGIKEIDAPEFFRRHPVVGSNQ